MKQLDHACIAPGLVLEVNVEPVGTLDFHHFPPIKALQFRVTVRLSFTSPEQWSSQLDLLVLFVSFDTAKLRTLKTTVSCNANPFSRMVLAHRTK